MKVKSEILSKKVNELCDHLGIEIIVISKDRNKPVDKKTWDFIQHLIMVGVFVNDMGGLKEVMK